MQLSLLDEHRLRFPSCTDAEHVERIAAETIEFGLTDDSCHWIYETRNS